MSLDKAIKSGKEHRKPYRKAKAVDTTCRNHGSCIYCQGNRQYKNKKRIEKTNIDLLSNKCEWCEENRYKILLHVMNKDKGSYAIEYDNYDIEPYLDIIYKPQGDVFWETQFAIKINYCPFCGKKLGGGII